jgi:hypothetical protein
MMKKQEKLELHRLNQKDQGTIRHSNHRLGMKI